MSAVEPKEQYEGTVVQVGNSRGMRLPALFFRSHPEFNGKVHVTVVADGAVLISAKPLPRRKSRDDENDPVIASFLRFMESQMIDHPEDVVAVDADQLSRIASLIRGVEAD